MKKSTKAGKCHQNKNLGVGGGGLVEAKIRTKRKSTVRKLKTLNLFYF